MIRCLVPLIHWNQSRYSGRNGSYFSIDARFSHELLRIKPGLTCFPRVDLRSFHRSILHVINFS